MANSGSTSLQVPQLTTETLQEIWSFVTTFSVTIYKLVTIEGFSDDTKSRHA